MFSSVNNDRNFYLNLPSLGDDNNNSHSVNFSFMAVCFQRECNRLLSSVSRDWNNNSRLQENRNHISHSLPGAFCKLKCQKRTGYLVTNYLSTFISIPSYASYASYVELLITFQGFFLLDVGGDGGSAGCCWLHLPF